MSFTPWTDVLMAVGIILTLVALYTAKKAEAVKEQEPEADELSEEPEKE